MIPYTGEYIEHFDPEKPNLTFYTFTPRPLMRGDMYQMDDELAALLIEAHRNIGFLERLVKYAPNKEAFAELMLLKECTYSHMIDYDGPNFKEILTIRGTGKGDIIPITNLEMAFKAAKSMEVAAPDLSWICGIALNGESENNPIEVRNHQTFWLGARTNLKGYNPTVPDGVLPALADISAYLYNDHSTDSLIKAAIEDLEHLMDIENLPKSVFSLYEYLERCPIINSSTTAKNIGLSFNSISKAIRVLQEHDIVVQISDTERNRTWKYRSFNMDADNI